MNAVANGNHRLATRSIQFFSSPSILRRLSVDDQRLIRENEMSYENISHYVRTLFTGTSEIINSTTQEQVGRCSFNQGKLPANQNMVLSGMRLAYGFTAAGGETNPAAIKYTNSDTPSLEVPAAIMNGVLEFVISRGRVMTVPVCKFFQREGAAQAEGIQGFSDCIVLEALELITPDSQIIVELKTAQGISLPAGNHFLEFQFYGIGSRRAAN
jgi:hypothetical protein